MNPVPMLILENASVRFGDVQALRDVTLTVQRGDFVGLVGANGSGKTTFLKIVAGDEPFPPRRSPSWKSCRRLIQALSLANLPRVCPRMRPQRLTSTVDEQRDHARAEQSNTHARTLDRHDRANPAVPATK